MRVLGTVLGGLVVAGLAAGCGYDCQSACTKVYAEDDCNKPTPGQDWSEAWRDCVDECETALRYPGELGDYDPNSQQTSAEAVELQNEAQAAAWMDCVENTACELIEKGTCEI